MSVLGKAGPQGRDGLIEHDFQPSAEGQTCTRCGMCYTWFSVKGNPVALEARYKMGGKKGGRWRMKVPPCPPK